MREILERKIILFQRYWDDDEREKRIYKMTGLVANIHHTITIILIFHMFQSPDPEVCTENSKPWAFFNSEQCFYALDKRYVYLCFFSAGYFTYDYIAQIFSTKERNSV